MSPSPSKLNQILGHATWHVGHMSLCVPLLGHCDTSVLHKYYQKKIRPFTHKDNTMVQDCQWDQPDHDPKFFCPTSAGTALP